VNITIRDVAGRSVGAWKKSPVGGQVTLELNGLAKGTYFLQLQQNDKNELYPIIIN
jgi:hypothetical protein